MSHSQGFSVYDGTTGRSDHGGRRTHIIQLLRDAKAPVSVADVASRVGIHVNPARFHLESLVDAGMAERKQQARDTPGRPKVLYIGTLPNQTHERAQGYRLLAEILTTTVAQNLPNATEVTYEVGQSWGRYLTDTPPPFARLTEEEVTERLISKMDALWFAPSITEAKDGAATVRSASRASGRAAASSESGVAEGSGGEELELVLHNCPFLDAAQRHPEVVCTLHAGLINGTLAELGSPRRASELKPLVAPHLCVATLSTIDPASYNEADPVPVITQR